MFLVWLTVGVGEGGKDYIHKTKYEYIMKYCEGYTCTGDVPEKYYIENTYFNIVLKIGCWKRKVFEVLI